MVAIQEPVNAIAERTATWPVPRRNWSMAMSWHDLLFMHWPVDAEPLRAALPRGMELDLFDGQAWLAVVPFHMTGIRHRQLPELPLMSAFPELNVRTYVTVNGRPGVYFYSLDAGHALAVAVARATFHLRYFRARIGIRHDGGAIHYRSERIHRGAPPATFEARYRPTGEPRLNRPGTLEHFLTERYCLYSADAAGGIHCGQIAHLPWQLQPAEAEELDNTMTGQLNSSLPNDPPLLHFAKRMDVVAWRVWGT